MNLTATPKRACTSCNRRRSRTRLHRGECSTCTGLIGFPFRDALGRFLRLATRTTRPAKARRRRRPVVTTIQPALF